MARKYYYRIVVGGQRYPSQMGTTLAAMLKTARAAALDAGEACVERARVLPHGRQGEWTPVRCIRKRRGTSLYKHFYNRHED